MDELKVNYMKRAFYAGFCLGYEPMTDVDDWERLCDKFMEQFKAHQTNSEK